MSSADFCLICDTMSFSDGLKEVLTLCSPIVFSDILFIVFKCLLIGSSSNIGLIL